MADVIWSNDVNEILSDPEIQQDEYDQYVERMDDSGMEPKSFDAWLDTEYWEDYSLQEIQYDYVKEDFYQFIMPMVERAANNFPVFLIGSRSGWRAGSGGIAWDSAEKFGDWVFNRDYDNITTISNDNGIMTLSSSDHDGSTGGTLYTLPSDEQKLITLLKEATTYPDDVADYRDEYQEGMTDDEIMLDLFYTDLNQVDLYWGDFIQYPEYLEPIAVTM